MLHPRARILLVVPLLAAPALACGGSAPRPDRAPNDATVSIPAAEQPEPATPNASETDTTRSRCPIVPLRLLIRPMPPASDRPMRVMTLAGDGAVSFAMLDSAAARLDDNGCLTVAGEVAVDASSPNAIWTVHERFTTSGDRIELGAGRSMRIRDDGSVETFDRDGKPEKLPLFFFEGHRPEAACAAAVMLVAFMASMPSMAISDGNPPRLPPPAGSPCPHSR